MKFGTVLSIASLAIALAACGSESDNNTGRPPLLPRIFDFGIGLNGNSVLVATAAYNTADADSARVVFWSSDGVKQYTPYTTTPNLGPHIVLGLRPLTSYSFVVEAVNRIATVTSDTASATTGPLPPFLAAASLAGASPSSGGYILTALRDGSTAYAVAFDSAGQVAWYRAFPGGVPVVETKQQKNGAISVILTTSFGGDTVTGHALALTPDEYEARPYDAPLGSYLDPHELVEISDVDGHYAGAVYFAYTARHLDLHSTGGTSDTVVTGHQIIKRDNDGNATVLFDAWDHFAISDNVEPTPGALDFDHPNSLSIADDGNYVVSWRNLDVITKINSNTGALMWTLAGPFATIASDFTIVANPLNGFSAQHSVRSLPNGNLLIFDNGTRHATPRSRAVEYQLNTGAHTATMVWQYTHTPPYFTAFTGSVQRLKNGDTLIGWTYGSPLVATEVDAAGSVV